MNGRVTTATVTVSNMPTLTPLQKKKKGCTLTHRKAAKTKTTKTKAERKQAENGLTDDKTADVLKVELHEQQKPQDVVETEEKGCALCKMRGEHQLVDLRKNSEMRKTFSAYLGVPLKNIEPALANICVQCVLKINLNTEITRNLKISLRRVVNGQTSSTTENSTQQQQNSNDISPEKQMNTCPPKASVHKTKNKVSTHSSPTKSCSKSLPTQHLTTSTKPNNALPDITSRLNTPQPIAASTPAAKIAPTLIITKPTSAESSLIASSTDTSLLIGSCDISPSPSYSPIKPRCSNESNTISNTINDSTKKSPQSEVVVRLKKGKFLEQQNVPVDLSKRNSAISIRSPIPPAPAPSPHPVPSSPLPSAVPLLLEATKDASLADSDPISAGQNHSMLEVFYERSESALVTESGGKINKYGTERLPTQQLICPTCRKCYRRKNYFAKHVRRCRGRVAASKASNFDQPILDPSVEITPAPTRAASRKRTFYCNECPVTLDSMLKLRDHKHIHLQRFYCKTCGKESMARQEHEYHTVSCLAKKLSLDTSTMKETQSKVPEKRITRSMSRAASRSSTRFQNSHLSDEDTSDMTENEDDDQFEAASVADTMYTKRMRFTGHWLEDHSNSVSHFSDDDISYDFDDELLTDKELDHYRLDKLKMMVHLNRISCFVPSCVFLTDDLVLLMKHEYADHRKRLWFHCKKCRCGFTNKVFLDYHLACQNGGRFICYKCGDLFEFQHLLERHLIRHTKCFNHHCNYCNFEFLSEDELLQHCDIEQHDANGTRKLIRIDHTMTIANPLPPEPPNEAGRNYQVRILEMKLPKLPTKRPRPRPGNLPYRLRVGEVLFENQKNPNCWGWK